MPPQVLPLSAEQLAYISDEVERQGHDLSNPKDGGVRVAGMAEAWQKAIAAFVSRDRPPSWSLVREFGALIETRNAKGWRKVPIYVGMRPAGSHHSQIDSDVLRLLTDWPTLGTFDLYRRFEEIHPFVDGNGRTGKILLNWRNGTLDAPIFPPNDFWGRWIQNP